MIIFCHSRGPQLTFLKKWSFFVTDRGPQLTFLKKRSFFVTDGGPQLTFLKSDHFSSLMGGINWPSCERDHFSSLIPADLLEKWSFFANERGPTDLLDAHIMFYPIITTLDGWGVGAGISKNVTDRHFLLLMQSHNWPFRCLNYVSRFFPCVLFLELKYVNIWLFKFIEACKIELRGLVNILRWMELGRVTIESNLAA